MKVSKYLGLENSTVASYAIPIGNLVNGTPSLPLRDEYLENIQNAALLVEIKIEDLVQSKLEENPKSVAEVQSRTKNDIRINAKLFDDSKQRKGFLNLKNRYARRKFT